MRYMEYPLLEATVHLKNPAARLRELVLVLELAAVPQEAGAHGDKVLVLKRPYRVAHGGNAAREIARKAVHAQDARGDTRLDALEDIELALVDANAYDGAYLGSLCHAISNRISFPLP